MSDNFDDLETGASCYAISDSKTIYSFKNGVRDTYHLISGKWYKTASDNVYIYSDYNCYDYDDLIQLNSYSFLTPFYHAVSFALVFFVVFLFWFLSKRLFKWRG